MIPEAAVEAAARQLAAHEANYDAWPDHYRAKAVAALEAAAPHMQSRAWEEGYGLGYSDHMWDKGHEPRTRNPYRPTP